MSIYVCLHCKTLETTPGLCRKCGENLNEYVSADDTAMPSDMAGAMKLMGKIGGSAKTDAKKASSAANGKLGGRPKKIKTQD